MGAFVRNHWYVAAYGREVGREILGRTVLDEPIALYRTEDGTVAALADRCIHRRYPLSAVPSRVVGDAVVCGYHGFTYDGTGACVAVPGQTRIPRTARVKSYPVVEQDSFVWVFIGDPTLADATEIPRPPWLAAPAWTTVSGMEPSTTATGCSRPRSRTPTTPCWSASRAAGGRGSSSIYDHTSVMTTQRRSGIAEQAPAPTAARG